MRARTSPLQRLYTLWTWKGESFNLLDIRYPLEFLELENTFKIADLYQNDNMMT